MLIWFATGMALVGFCIAAYFTLAYYGWLPPGAAHVPVVCRRGEGGANAPGMAPASRCTSVLRTRYASAFGLPNSLLGLLYYAAVISAALAGALPRLAAWYLAAGAVTVALGAYLTYHLVITLRIPCRLCLASHAINLALTVVYGALLIA